MEVSKKDFLFPTRKVMSEVPASSWKSGAGSLCKYVGEFCGRHVSHHNKSKMGILGFGIKVKKPSNFQNIWKIAYNKKHDLGSREGKLTDH